MDCAELVVRVILKNPLPAIASEKIYNHLRS